MQERVKLRARELMADERSSMAKRYRFARYEVGKPPRYLSLVLVFIVLRQSESFLNLIIGLNPMIRLASESFFPVSDSGNCAGPICGFRSEKLSDLSQTIFGSAPLASPSCDSSEES